MDQCTRRGFLKYSMSGAGTLLIPSWGKWALADVMNQEPHFFVQLFFPNGLDNSYLFDARPLDMTKAGIIQNYLGKDPIKWDGSNGVSTLASPLVEPLKPYKDYFSVLNGVHTTAAFDGHDQNTNYFFTGNPFGGESYIPVLNVDKMPLDAVQNGSLNATFTNKGGTVPLTAGSASQVISKVKASTRLKGNSSLFQFLRSRMQQNSAGVGKFSKGSGKMLEGFDQVPSLAQILNRVDLPTGDKNATDVGTMQGGMMAGTPGMPNPSNDAEFFKIITELFKYGATRSAVVSYGVPEVGLLDTHDPTTAKAQPENFGKVVSKIATLFKVLRETPFDQTRSFLDVTTVVVGSEFGRTLRQLNKKIDETGTDHNTLANEVLIGGKGIKGGLVIGSSDLQSTDETLSSVHNLLDAAKLKKMGRAFDFANFASIEDGSDKYDPYKYLNTANVVNTVYSLFGVSKTKYRVLKTDGAAATVLGKLLV